MPYSNLQLFEIKLFSFGSHIKWGTSLVQRAWRKKFPKVIIFILFSSLGLFRMAPEYLDVKF